MDSSKMGLGHVLKARNNALNNLHWGFSFARGGLSVPEAPRSYLEGLHGKPGFASSH